jgi:hypothetical protein
MRPDKEWDFFLPLSEAMRQTLNPKPSFRPTPVAVTATEPSRATFRHGVPWTMNPLVATAQMLEPELPHTLWGHCPAAVETLDQLVAS